MSEDRDKQYFNSYFFYWWKITMTYRRLELKPNSHDHLIDNLWTVSYSIRWCFLTEMMASQNLRSEKATVCYIVLYCIQLYCILLYWIVLYIIVLYCIILYCIDGGGHCCSMHCYLFEIYRAPPNLGITRTWICRLKLWILS